jgi:hypothetical protein
MVMNPIVILSGISRQDFLMNYHKGTYQQTGEISRLNALISHVILCDVYELSKIRNLVPPGKDIWKRIEQNQDERYHHLKPAQVEDMPVSQLPDLYLDFKKVFGIATETLYEGLRIGTIRRVALVPPIYIHDLIHRFYGFLSRVALPE